MVLVKRSDSGPKSSASKLRFSLHGVIIVLAIASILLSIPALIFLKTSKEAVDHHIISAIDLPRNEVPPPPSMKVRSHPGLRLRNEPSSVSCGSHHARSCDECPQGHGASWCNDQCIWKNEQCVHSAKVDHNNKNMMNLQIESADADEEEEEEEPHKPKAQDGKLFQSYPGLTDEPSVTCGAHKARSCDECPQGHGASWCNDQCEWKNEHCVKSANVESLHPDYFRITSQRYAFSPVWNQNDQYVNIIMVRSPFRDKDDENVFQFYKDGILFLGISSFESYPLTSPNPYSAKYESEYYLNMFPGFLHMVCADSLTVYITHSPFHTYINFYSLLVYWNIQMRDPNNYFPPKVETALISQSDFQLEPAQKFGQEHANDEKIYDFVYTGGVSIQCTNKYSLLFFLENL